MPLDPRRPLSVAQIAARWECSEGLIRKLMTTGQLKHFKIGNMARVRAEEVDRFEAIGASKDRSSD